MIGGFGGVRYQVKDVQRAITKSLIGSALVGFVVRQHAWAGVAPIDDSDISHVTARGI
jgi:hypothetical protein